MTTELKRIEQMRDDFESLKLMILAIDGKKELSARQDKMLTLVNNCAGRLRFLVEPDPNENRK